jgi:hypothetical protein
MASPAPPNALRRRSAGGEVGQAATPQAESSGGRRTTPPPPFSSAPRSPPTSFPRPHYSPPGSQEQHGTEDAPPAERLPLTSEAARLVCGGGIGGGGEEGGGIGGGRGTGGGGGSPPAPAHFNRAAQPPTLFQAERRLSDPHWGCGGEAPAMHACMHAFSSSLSNVFLRWEGRTRHERARRFIQSSAGHIGTRIRAGRALPFRTGSAAGARREACGTARGTRCAHTYRVEHAPRLEIPPVDVDRSQRLVRVPLEPCRRPALGRMLSHRRRSV